MRLLCVVTVLVCLQLGCETRVSLGVPCRNDNECASGLRCNFGRCRAGCETSSECSPGQHCLTINTDQGACTLPTDTCDPAALRYCEDGLTCVNQSCVSRCSTSNTCLSGSSCDVAAAACLPTTVVRPDAGTEDASSAPDAFLCEAPVPTTVAHSTLCVGKDFGCAVVAGQVHCWGGSRGGQLGDGVNDHTPRTDPPCASGSPCTAEPTTVIKAGDGQALTNVVSIGCGEAVCALTDTGDVWCWGYLAETPVAQAYRYAEGATSITVGRRHVCADIGGSYFCWGNNTSSPARYPQLDFMLDRRLGHARTLVSYPVLADDFVGSERVTAGAYFTCAARCGGVYCQGFSEGTVCGNAPARQADGMGVSVVVPVGNRIMDGHPDDIHAGQTHACVLLDGVVSCFGGNTNGALGNPVEVLRCETLSVFECRPTPRPIDLRAAPSLRFTALSHGQASTTCAITEGSGEVYCWGQSELGQAGGTTDWSTQLHGPVASESGPLTGVTEVSVGDTSTCARRSDGRIFCWGGNEASQLGMTSDHVPHTVAVEVSLP